MSERVAASGERGVVAEGRGQKAEVVGALEGLDPSPRSFRARCLEADLLHPGLRAPGPTLSRGERVAQARSAPPSKWPNPMERRLPGGWTGGFQPPPQTERQGGPPAPPPDARA